jgi:hypothetical protein
LYFVDGYNGLFSFDLESKVARHLVSTQTSLEAPEGADPTTKRPISFLDDLVVSSNGEDIVMSDVRSVSSLF